MSSSVTNEYSFLNREMNVLFSGRRISLSSGVAESDEEVYYRMMHSLVEGSNPESVGMIDTFKVNGMQFQQERGYSPDISKTMIVRMVVQEATFRPALIRYIQRYTPLDDAAILRAIGRNNTDEVVIQNLSRLPRKTRPEDDMASRVHAVTNLLCRIPHVPIIHYLDYGTGSGQMAAGIANALSVVSDSRRVVIPQGVDTFPMERQIPTRTIRSGERFPDEWTNKFHLITALATLHHVQDQEQVLGELYRVLAPGGVLILREHDYRDMTPRVILRTQKVHVDGPQGSTLGVNLQLPLNTQETRVLGGDPFRHFLDAIHVVSMAFSDDMRGVWSLYRSRMEWHSMLQREGFIHMCTVSSGFSNVSSQMEKRINTCAVKQQKPIRDSNPQVGIATGDTVDSTSGDEEETPEDNSCTGWLSLNPQRLYEAVYSKPIPMNQRESIPMILEYKLCRELRVESYFPRKGGRSGTSVSEIIRPGVNYDEEVLAYMTPWYAAQQTSALISRLIRQEYGEEVTVQPTPSNPNPAPRRRSPKFRLYDGTGGAGGNTLAFASNRDITSIHVYERIPRFFKYIVNNVQLYTDQVAQPIDSRQLPPNMIGLRLTHTIAPPPPKEGSTFQLRPFEQSIYMYNGEFPLQDLIVQIPSRGQDVRTMMSESVLFLDVPWISEGCGYKLSGYTYAGDTLENVAIKVLQAGAYMVVFKLPPGYRLELKHFVEELGKESLYIVYRRFIRPVTRSTSVVTIQPSIPVVPMTVQGGNPAVELIRYRLMDHLRTQFRTLISGSKRDDYYLWVYERIRTYGLCDDKCALDPVIPATPSFVSSTVVTTEPFWPDMPFTQLSDLIRREYPELIPQLQRTFFLDTQAVVALRRAVADLISQRQGENIRKVMQELDTLARDLYQQFIQASSVAGIAASVSLQERKISQRETITSVVITPNQTLRQVLNEIDTRLNSQGRYPTCENITAFACVTILPSKLSALRERYRVVNGSVPEGTFEQHLAAMLLRYSIMMEPSRETSFSGVNLHAAIPPAMFTMLSQRLGVTTESFASPLNATLRYFMSAFPDTDAPFGCIGSFFRYDFRHGGLPSTTPTQLGPSGSYEANPPFTEDMIQAMIDRMSVLLQQADEKNTALSFFVVVPNWSVPQVDAIRNSPWKRFDMVVPASQHRFIAGQQHIQNTMFTANFDTYVAILQSRVGVTTYPIPPGFNTLIMTSFT